MASLGSAFSFVQGPGHSTCCVKYTVIHVKYVAGAKHGSSQSIVVIVSVYPLQQLCRVGCGVPVA